MKRAICFIFAALCVQDALSQENGKFVGTPVILEQHPGGKPKPFKLFREVIYTDPSGDDWKVPAGSFTDGATIPWLAELITGDNYSGPYLAAAVVHDFYCCVQTRDQVKTHHNFYYGMRADNTDGWLAWLMYAAVRLGGPTWSDLKSENGEISGECVVGGPMAVSKDLAAPAATWPVTGPTAAFAGAAISAEKERNRFVASKVVAIAKTLRETDGQYLDVGPDGRIEASFEGVETIVSAARAAVTFNNYTGGTTDFRNLGLLAPIEGDLEEFVAAVASQGGLAKTATEWNASELSTIGIAAAELPSVLPGDYLANVPAASIYDKVGVGWANPALKVEDKVIWNNAITADKVIQDWQANFQR
ncbi:DUF1353 domain-containing protein [Mesorhizobium sp. J428]|uniref:DUF1353 domain-containing protein n=1 Tax=Mesorhizobium sp. J428 TaxID=2898440 RepID=UPI0021508C48|nr:DUF1353 domain-containing protein [Mesorhizobium sp. J428]